MVPNHETKEEGFQLPECLCSVQGSTRQRSLGRDETPRSTVWALLSEVRLPLASAFIALRSKLVLGPDTGKNIPTYYKSTTIVINSCYDRL
ncbi:hypothetical protein DV515_00002867 [Chloebia gouldiae]|uniref:Uncharacterized protein n=1 Tax=Chloebia gouldiae TaxID=44316 RepID=A0A3L8SUQ2_CHLGU|nr:hypothetical protein DV515_00002867 [Chloebia gouldiae]